MSDNVIGTLTPETFRLRRERAQRLWDAGEMDMQTYALVTTVLLFAQRIDETEAILRDVAAIYFRIEVPSDAVRCISAQDASDHDVRCPIRRAVELVGDEGEGRA